MYTLQVEHLHRRFGRHHVLRDIQIELTTGQSMAIIGKNGSGKSTLLNIIAGLLAPSRGRVRYLDGERELNAGERRLFRSLVGPELALYDTLTAHENLAFFARMRGSGWTARETTETMNRVGLAGRENDFYGQFSSGMKQRLKYAVALMNDPHLLLLDEPTANLDDEGKRFVREVIDTQRKNGILVVATNETEEYRFADTVCRVDG
jgi:heme exporter protein A